MKRIDYLIEFLEAVFGNYSAIEYKITKLPISEYGSHVYSVKFSTNFNSNTREVIMHVNPVKKIMTLVEEDYCEISQEEFITYLFLKDFLEPKQKSYTS